MAGTNRVSQFDYLNDAIGRRTQRLDTLAGYALPVTNDFGYNLRSELTDALMGMNEFGYVFDPIGNRELERVNLTTGKRIASHTIVGNCVVFTHVQVNDLCLTACERSWSRCNGVAVGSTFLADAVKPDQTKDVVPSFEVLCLCKCVGARSSTRVIRDPRGGDCTFSYRGEIPSSGKCVGVQRDANPREGR